MFDNYQLCYNVIYKSQWECFVSKLYTPNSNQNVQAYVSIQHAKRKCINSGSPSFLSLFQYFSRSGSQTQEAPCIYLRLGTTVLSKHRPLLLTASKKKSLFHPEGGTLKNKKRTNLLFGKYVATSPPPYGTSPSHTIYSRVTCTN